jgi:hypothetical protein
MQCKTDAEGQKHSAGAKSNAGVKRVLAGVEAAPQACAWLNQPKVRKQRKIPDNVQFPLPLRASCEGPP